MSSIKHARKNRFVKLIRILKRIINYHETFIHNRFVEYIDIYNKNRKKVLNMNKVEHIYNQCFNIVNKNVKNIDVNNNLDIETLNKKIIQTGEDDDIFKFSIDYGYNNINNLKYIIESTYEKTLTNPLDVLKRIKQNNERNLLNVFIHDFIDIDDFFIEKTLFTEIVDELMNSFYVYIHLICINEVLIQILQGDELEDITLKKTIGVDDNDKHANYYIKGKDETEYLSLFEFTDTTKTSRF